jgi:hypothetical protein
MDPDEYRKQYDKEIRSASSRGRKRGADVESMGTRELVSAIKDTKRKAPERVRLIEAATAGAVGKPSLMQGFLKVLGDPEENDSVRLAALKALQVNSFSAIAFRRYQADYRDALRSAATDDDAALRSAAMEPLALAGDEYVQRLLVDGLENPDQALVPAQRALQLIGYDVHAEYYPVLRDIATTKAKRSPLRRSALRLLAADSESTDLFADIAADKSEDPAARSTSAIALQSLSPDQFQEVARDVVLDDDDDDKVRATIVNAITHQDSEPDAAVQRKVRTMARPTAPSGALRTAAREYVRQQDVDT